MNKLVPPTYDSRKGTGNNYRSKQGPGIVIAGGGTGGHLFPGIAIAEAFRRQSPENRVLFVSTGRPLEVSALADSGFDLERISVEGIKGRRRMDQLVSAMKIPGAIVESVRILKRFRPGVVIGVGGYSSGPVAAAAWLLGIRLVLHEQNIIAGLTNRILSRMAYRVCLSFDSVPPGIDPRKVLVTGNPVRRDILEHAGSMPEKSISSAASRPFTVLIIGGSQGAHRINVAMMEALESISDKARFSFIHQTGASDERMVRQQYETLGIQGDVRAFFTDMARRYAGADLIICRAGATTVAEITAVGKPALFIPFPSAADNHQELNARGLVDRGAAQMILEKDLSGKQLADRIQYLAGHRFVLDEMASRARSFGRRDAAQVIADLCSRLLKEECGPQGGE